jgi:hypothetical protein
LPTSTPAIRTGERSATRLEVRNTAEIWRSEVKGMSFVNAR